MTRTIRNKKSVFHYPKTIYSFQYFFTFIFSYCDKNILLSTHYILGMVLSTVTCSISYSPYQSPIRSYSYYSFTDEASESHRNYING